MANAADMSTPVTRGELREELEQLRQELDLKLAPLATKAELAPLATKAELEIWGGALLARITSGEQRLIERIERTEQQLQVDLAHHAKAIQESMATLISAIDEKYADLPGRVQRLEIATFGPEQR